jgi:putative lipoprotein
MNSRHLLPLLAVGALLGCRPDPAPITGKEWRVAAINDLVNPVGAGGRPLTIRFHDSTGSAYGYAGCNQYNARYSVTGDSLSFGVTNSSRMACAESDSLEALFLQALPKVQHYSFTDSHLVLTGEGTAIRLR